MKNKQFIIFATAFIAIAIWAILVWDYTHGGVPSHHILNDSKLPAISNWWGGILLPALTWILVSRIEKREKLDEIKFSNIQKKTIYGFLIALLFSILISLLVTFEIHTIPSYLLLSILAIAVFYPIYRSECLLGFVLGMTYTIGGVLPVGVGLILSLIGLVIYKLINLTKRLIFRK